jgi:squalene-hopene/tetraprenyl-beta-curcumene cyclase
MGLVVAIAAGACAGTTAKAPRGGAGGVASASASAGASASASAGWEARAAAYLDGRAIGWLEHPLHVTKIPQNFDCAMTCHTTHPFVVARAALPQGVALERVRGAIEARVAKIADWSSAVPMYGDREKEKTLARWSFGAEAVMNASALALGDRTMGRSPTRATLRAIDLMWSAQRADGAWDWFEFGLEPWEGGGDVGLAFAALAVAALPAEDAAPAKANIERLRGAVGKRLADTAKPLALHHRALLLWASAKWKEVLTDAARASIVRELVERQQPSGGWSLATWGRGKLARDGADADGYATAIAVLALCSTQVEDAAKKRGLTWLRGAQQGDGSWPGRSVNANKEPNDGFMTDAATAYAVLAIARCGG